MTTLSAYEYVTGAFQWVLPHPLSWVLGLAFGVVVFGFLVVHMNARRGRWRISHSVHFLIATAAVALYAGFHFNYVVSFEGVSVLGGFVYRPEMESDVKAGMTKQQITSRHGGFADVEEVWTSNSLMMTRVVAALLFGLLIGSIGAYVERVPRIRHRLNQLASRSPPEM